MERPGRVRSKGYTRRPADDARRHEVCGIGAKVTENNTGCFGKVFGAGPAGLARRHKAAKPGRQRAIPSCLRASPITPDGQHDCCDRRNSPRSRSKNRCPTTPGIRYNGTMTADIAILRAVPAVTAGERRGCFAGASVGAGAPPARFSLYNPVKFVKFIRKKETYLNRNGPGAAPADFSSAAVSVKFRKNTKWKMAPRV